MFYHPEARLGATHLGEDESRHCVKVLRCQQGDAITLIDGAGGWYEAKITEANPKRCAYAVLRTTQTPPKAHYIHVAIAPTKQLERLEWFVEKAVEVGIDEVSFVVCAQSERKTLKTDRLTRKAISAITQSIKARLPQLNPACSFAQAIDTLRAYPNKYIAHLGEGLARPLAKTAPEGQKYCVLVGPEGDFSPKEVQQAMEAGFTPVSLGPSRLRTETAGLVACHTLNLING